MSISFPNIYICITCINNALTRLADNILDKVPVNTSIYVQNILQGVFPNKMFTYWRVRDLLMPASKPESNPDSEVHESSMGPTWVLSAPDGPHVGPINLAIGEAVRDRCHNNSAWVRILHQSGRLYVSSRYEHAFPCAHACLQRKYTNAKTSSKLGVYS